MIIDPTVNVASLEQHRIAAIDRATVESLYPRTVGRNSFRGSHGKGHRHDVIIVTTHRGKIGWGPSLGPLGDVARLIGRNVADLIEPEHGVIREALSLDYPLHDLAGRILDVPVYHMLGDSGSKQLPVYSGAIYLDDLDPIEAPGGLANIKRNLAQDACLGYRDFKLKIGRGYRWMPHAEGMARDIEVTKLARECFPTARILVDVNDGYSVRDVSEYLSAVSDVGLYWIEEPFAERREDLEELRRVLAECTPATFIADGEYHPDVPAIIGLATQGLIDVLLMDVLSHGLTAWRSAMPDIVASDAAISPHAWGSPLKTFYAAQIGAGLGRARIIEGVPGVTLGVDASAYQFENGMLSVPDLPGFGLSLTHR